MIPGSFQGASFLRPSGPLTQKLQMDSTASKIQLVDSQKFIYAIGGAVIKPSHLVGPMEGGGVNTDVGEFIFHLPLEDPRRSSRAAQPVQVLTMQARRPEFDAQMSW